MISFRLTIAATAALAALAPSVAAQASVINFNNSGYGELADGQGRVFTGSDGIKVRVTAWSKDDRGIVQDSALGIWDQGLGINNGNDNSHTVDNNGWVDFLLFQFERSVALGDGRFQTGWHNSNDTDAFIGLDDLSFSFTDQPAWEGQGFDTALAGFKPFIASGSAGNSGDNSRNINPGGRSANAWVIGAALPVGGNAYGQDNKYDGFKLKTLNYTLSSTPVPEPASWAFLLAGFGAVSFTMRRPRQTGRLAHVN